MEEAQRWSALKSHSSQIPESILFRISVFLGFFWDWKLRIRDPETALPPWSVELTLVGRQWTLIDRQQLLCGSHVGAVRYWVTRCLHQVPDTRCQVQGTRYQVQGTRCKYQVLGDHQTTSLPSKDNLVAWSHSSSCSGLVTSSQELQSPHSGSNHIWHHWSGFKEQFLFGRLTLRESLRRESNPRPSSSCRTCGRPPRSSWTSDRHRRQSAQLCNRKMTI